MRIVTFLLALLLPSIALAAPTVSLISGNLGHGQEITITGSEFGTKTNPTPLIWDTFDHGSVGKTIASSGIWATERGGSTTVYSNLYPRHSFSVLNARHTVSSTNDEFSKQLDLLNTNGSKLFVSFWLRIDFASGWDDSADQLKVMRLTSNNSYSSPPKMLWQAYSTDNQTMSQSYISAYDSNGTALGGGLGRGSSVNGGIPKLTEHQWVNVQVTWHNSTTPTTVKFLVAPGGVLYRGVSYDNVSTLGSSSGPYLNTLKLGYHQNNGPLAYNHWDDIYVDNSWARVEIGDQSVYDNCTHREVQIPSAWSTNSIKFNVNQGAFKSGTEAFLFVVDANGVTSPGKKITIGTSPVADSPTSDGSNTTSTVSQPPLAPKDLRIL